MRLKEMHIRQISAPHLVGDLLYTKYSLKEHKIRNSLAVQWLGLSTLTAEIGRAHV